MSRTTRGAVALALAALASCAAARAEDFPKLAEHRSHEGVLSVTLTAEPKVVMLDGVKVEAQVFNGDYGGPVLRLKPGDVLKIHLVNHLPEAINLHFHGSHASPLGRSDNMHVVVGPGKSFDYELKTPKSQPPGLYWYHTHIHGHAENQIARGLSGAMVIEGLERRVPEARGLRQRLMVLKTFTAEEGEDPRLQALHGVVQTINGAGRSDLSMTVGTPELWRISNQAPNDYYHLSAKGLQFEIVAMDGSPTNHNRVVDRLDLPPAGRIEAIVTATAPGATELISGATATGLGRNLKTVRVLAGIAATPAARTEAAVDRPARAPQTGDLSKANITDARSFHFEQKPGEEIYMINGKSFDHDRLDTRVALGSVEEWTIYNDTDDMHVFHIHQVHFQVMAINGTAQPFEGVVDDVKVPERGSVTVRIPFTDPQIVGRFMYHCHVLKHEDKGMMANIEVYDPAAEAMLAHHHH